MARGVGIKITVDDKPLVALFTRIAQAGEDPSDLLDDIGASEVVSVQQRFETETDPSGRKWVPLRPATIRAKRGDTRILRRRGRLFGSITHNATATYVDVGTNVRDYAAVHQFGATIEHFARSQMATFKRNKDGDWRFAKKRSAAKSAMAKPITIGAHSVTIPARSYLGISDGDRAMIIEKGEAWLKAKMEGGA